MLSRKLAVLALPLALVGCPDKTPPKEADRGGEPTRPADPPPPKGADPAVDDIPLDPKAEEDPARRPKVPAKVPTEVAVRQLLVAHSGAPRAEKGTRSRAEAERRARCLVAAARQKGGDFASLARRFSDAPDEERVFVETFHPGERGPVARAALGLDLGQVSDPIDGPAGFVVLERVEPEEYSTAHIVIMFKGTKLAPVTNKKTRAEAKALAEKIRALALKPDASFAVLAARNSDSPSGSLRGGVITPLGPKRLTPGMEAYLEAVKQLEVGEVSPVVETPYGFHVIKRLPLKKIVARHILVSYDGSKGHPREARSKADALKLALKVRKEAAAEGADFAKLARTHSDDSTAAKGGELPPFARGEMVPKFEQYAFALGVGGLSAVVETEFGFHIIRRER